MKPETDDYPTCAETYVTLRLYHQDADPDAVTAALGIQPTEIQRIGETETFKSRTHTIELAGWFLCTEPFVASYDADRHLTYLLDQLQDKHAILRNLIADGWRADIACLWDSAYGDGGPTLSPQLLARLADLGIELWFDVYFLGSYSLLRKKKQAVGMT